MTARPIVSALAFAALVSGFASPSASAEDTPKTFACTFRSGSTLTYSKSVYRAKKAKPLASYTARALPYDPELARSLYQDWLLQLVETHRLESASVDAGSPNRLEIKSRGQKKRKLVGHSFNMTLRAKTTLPQLVNLLHDFRQVGHLHKIRSLSLVPLGTGSELDVNMSIEVLSMQHADREDTLSTWVRDDENADPLKVYSDLLRRNLFARGLPQALAQIRLQAITTDKNGRKEAWLGTGYYPLQWLDDFADSVLYQDQL